jgi:hypothetical protein
VNDNEAEPKICESARFWRQNTLMAYRGVNLTESMAQDPEELAWMKAAKAEIAAIHARNNAVTARYRRIKGFDP